MVPVRLTDVNGPPGSTPYSYSPGMDDGRVRVRTRVMINGDEYELAQNEDLDDLKQRAERAVAPPGHFIDFMTVSGSAVSALVTPLTRLVFHTSKVASELWDSDARSLGYPGEFDY